MSAEQYLQMIQQDIHSVVFATIDENQFPVTCVIDIMLADKDGLYFLTAKGKAFYERLQNQPVISITGMIGNDTLSSKSVTLRGEVREIGQGLLSEIFEKNPYMKAIYPNAASRTALTVFQIYKGSGEFFDLSQKPIFRERFSFGGMESHMQYFLLLINVMVVNVALKYVRKTALIFLPVLQKYSKSIVYIVENVWKYAPCRQ